MAKQNNFINIGLAYNRIDESNTMEKRGVAIESLFYDKIDKGTKIQGNSVNCVIEQDGKIICNKDAEKFTYWSYEIEKIAPEIKGSFLGLGGYKNITITGISTKGVKASVSLSAKSRNKVTCNYRGNVSVYLSKLDITKFREWMNKWGVKFNLKRKGNVWLTMSEWQNFIIKIIIPYMYETVLNNKIISSSGMTMSYNGSCTLIDDVKEAIKSYLFSNLGITASIYFN